MTTLDIYERIKNILLKHKGEGNEISSAKIARIICISEDDTHAKTRKLIENTMIKYKLPLGSNQKGYFIIKSYEEFNKYIGNLEARQNGIEERKNYIKNFFKGEMIDEVYSKK